MQKINRTLVFLTTATLIALCTNTAAKQNDSVSLSLSKNQLTDIGQQIYLNETGGNPDYLISWNSGEAFASLGIGHFIWFPAALDSPFTESFPQLVAFFEANNIALPTWLSSSSDAPWQTQQAFNQAKDSKQMQELTELMSSTFDIQLLFIVQRMQAALPKMQSHLQNAQQKQLIKKRFDDLLKLDAGTYALVDYVNFKGEGTSQKEKYKGQGWGLMQVLLAMDKNATSATDAFADACISVLEQRVSNSPQADVEQRWLPGWRKRCNTYRMFGHNN